MQKIKHNLRHENKRKYSIILCFCSLIYGIIFPNAAFYVKLQDKHVKDIGDDMLSFIRHTLFQTS